MSEPPAGNQRDPNAQIAEWTAVVARWTRGLVIVGLITALILGFQYWILRQSDETARLRDRAFLHLGDPFLDAYPRGDGSKVLLAAITIDNVGNVPARSVTIQYDCLDRAKSDAVRDPFVVAIWKSPESPGVFPPNKLFTLQACQIPVATVKDSINGVRDIFYAVKVTYVDGFDLKTTRITEESRVLEFGQKFDLSKFRTVDGVPEVETREGWIGMHNCADEDCPK